jgi:hypothetical protein
VISKDDINLMLIPCCTEVLENFFTKVAHKKPPLSIKHGRSFLKQSS